MKTRTAANLLFTIAGIPIGVMIGNVATQDMGKGVALLLLWFSVLLVYCLLFGGKRNAKR